MVTKDVRSLGRRDVVLERRWRERVADWNQSGLTVREYYLRRGLTEPTFHYWKRELRARDEALMPTVAPSVTATAAAPPAAPLTRQSVLSANASGKSPAQGPPASAGNGSVQSTGDVAPADVRAGECDSRDDRIGRGSLSVGTCGEPVIL